MKTFGGCSSGNPAACPRIQRWRGAKGGVLPEGYDASATAAEAVAGLLREISARPHVGLNWERPTLAGLQEDLEQRIRGLVNRLHHRKETALVRSEADLAAVPTEEGEVIPCPLVKNAHKTLRAQGRPV